MPVLYGSRIDLPELLSTEIGAFNPETKTEVSSDETFLRWFVTIAEIGLSLIPGIGILGAAAIGLAGTAAQAGIDMEYEGKINWLSTGIGLGASVGGALLQGAGRAISNSALRSDLSKSAGLFGDATKFKMVNPDKYSLISGKARVQNLATGEIYKVGDVSVNGVMKNGQDIQASLFARDRIGMFTSERAIRKLPNKYLKMVTDALPENAANTMSLTARVNIRNSAVEIANRLGDIKQLARGVTRVSDIAESIEERSRRQALEKLFALTKLTPVEYRILKSIVKNGEITNKGLWYKILRKSYARTRNKFTAAIIEGTSKAKFIKMITQDVRPGIKFNKVFNKTVSYSKKTLKLLLTPKALVKKSVDKTVKRVFKFLEEQEQELLKKFGGFLKKNAKKVEDIFVKTGGFLIDSDVILGYKVLFETPESATILLQFRRDATQSASGKNANGKEPVIFSLTLGDLKSLAEATSPMGYYLDNFARSRGGRSPLDDLGLGDNITKILGYLPIGKINQIVGLAAIAKKFGTKVGGGKAVWSQTDKYLEKVSELFVEEVKKEGYKFAGHIIGGHNAIASSMVRSFTRGLVGGSVGDAFKTAASKTATKIGKRTLKKSGTGRQLKTGKKFTRPIKRLNSLVG